MFLMKVFGLVCELPSGLKPRMEALRTGKSLGKCLLVKHVNSSTEDNSLGFLLFLSKHIKIKAFEDAQTNAF